MHELMQDNLQLGKTLFKWINLIFAFCGINPINFNSVLHYSILSYIVSYLVLACLELGYLNKNSDEFPNAIMEICSMASILLKMSTYGIYRKTLAKIQEQVLKDYDNSSLYKNLEEVHVALKYVKQVKTYLTITVPLSFVNETMYYLTPLINNGFKASSSTDFQNATTYVLPYTVALHVGNDRDYWLAYIYLAPMCYCAIFCLGIDTTLMLALLAHVCGQLALLSECILPQIANDVNSFSIDISSNIERHSRLIRMAKDINRAFDWFLLNQYLMLMFFNCTIGFFFIMAVNQNSKVAIVTYSISLVSINTVLFLYCHAGQSLYNESMKLSDALYSSCWYNLNYLQLKYQLIFLTQSQICLRLTGKNICVFSYESFLKVIKSSMAYLSVLRKIL